MGDFISFNAAFIGLTGNMPSGGIGCSPLFTDTGILDALCHQESLNDLQSQGR